MAQFPGGMGIGMQQHVWPGVALPAGTPCLIPQRRPFISPAANGAAAANTLATGHQSNMSPTSSVGLRPTPAAPPPVFYQLKPNLKVPMSAAELEGVDLKTLYDVAAVLREEHTKVMQSQDSITQKLKELKEQYERQPQPKTALQLQNLQQAQLPNVIAKRKAIEATYANIEKVHRKKKDESTAASAPPEPSSPQSQYQLGTPGTVTKTPIKSLEAEGENPVLLDKKLADLMAQIDPRQKLDDDVEDLLVEFADEFIDDVVRNGCLLAHHRGSAELTAKDVVPRMALKWRISDDGTDITVRPKLRFHRPMGAQRLSQPPPMGRR